ncbi:MAG: hypothetical protein WCK02_00255 [Bacteroidota bacterium]
MSYITELRNKYQNDELTSSEGDRELRYHAFSPLFKNLYENKLIYRETRYHRAIVKLENIEITTEHFSARAIPYLTIEDPRREEFKRFPENGWNFYATWESIHLRRNALNTYSCWTIWVEPEFVEKIERLLLDKDFENAWRLIV